MGARGARSPPRPRSCLVALRATSTGSPSSEPNQVTRPATLPRPVRHASVSALRAARPSSFPLLALTTATIPRAPTPTTPPSHRPSPTPPPRSSPAMAGEDSHPSAAADDPCPLCGTAPGPARVTLAKRRLFAADSSMTTTTTTTAARAAAADEASARHVAGLHAELEAERAAAADAACEAMSMILRLQRDKSEAMMEARQYRRYAEERFAHDAAEADALRGAVARRDAAVRALAARLRDCQARLLHLGYDPPSPRAIQDHHHAFTAAHDDDGNYPSIQCLDHPAPADVGTPRTHHLLNRTPGAEPDPPVRGASPRHARTPSDDSSSYHPLDATADRGAPDEETDRVYTVDAVHGASASCWDEEEAEIQKLKARLHALEADRESMRRTIVSMGDDKLLLREVAHQLCKQGAVPMTPQPAVLPQRRLVKRRPAGFIKVFIATVIKWIASIFCWHKKSNRIKYPIGLCGSNIGLMLVVLDRYPKQRRRKFLKKEPSADIH